MAELPFVPNPFMDAEDVVEVPRPSTAKVSKPSAPSPPPAPKRAEKQKRKGGAPRDEGSKKPRPSDTASPHPVSSLFGEIAKNNFAAGDVQQWCSRADDEAEFSFKQAVGEVFFHGLTQISHKSTQIKELEAENARLKSAEAAVKADFDAYKKKSSEAARQMKNDLGRLQFELDTAQLNLLKERNEHSAGMAELQAKHTEAVSKHRKELSEAYSSGFLAYLKAFLGADPDYDWASKFPASTIQYMENFKVEHAAEIELERKRLEVKRLAEAKPEAASTDEVAAAGGEEDQVGGEEGPIASPTQTDVL